MLHAIARHIRSAHNHRRNVAELRALDDRMLDDIGVARGQIERAVLTGR